MDLADLVERARSMTTGPRRVLGLVGAPGSGKSTLAAQLAAATGRPETTPPQDVRFLRMLDGLPYGQGRQVIRIATVGPRDTVETLSARMAGDTKRERFMVLNGLTDDRPLAPGSLVKLVVAG